ncbi:DUF4249 domain-containing protein [Pontibacter chitinilyticus]|uniref:DUF4249 domain-containing protein n=1 Tax=Pontibacter chitinilyticus TaxID=2674989 RepID=UPI003218F9B9
MKAKRYLLLALLPLLALLYSCDMQQDVEVDLPSYTPQLVVECYLEPGKPMRMTVLESSSYFEAPQPGIVADAKVHIMHQGHTSELLYKPTYDEQTGRLYTHVSSDIMEGKPGDVYYLEVTDDLGRKVTGTTTILPQVPIDTIEWNFNDKDEAYLYTSFQDNAVTEDYYRYFVHQDSLHTDPKQISLVSDKLTNGNRTVFNSAYNYGWGDVLIVTLFHVEKQYYDYLLSTSNARNANGNPFAQPAQIKSSVQGGIGIFTNLAFDRKVVIVQ